MLRKHLLFNFTINFLIYARSCSQVGWVTSSLPKVASREDERTIGGANRPSSRAVSDAIQKRDRIFVLVLVLGFIQFFVCCFALLFHYNMEGVKFKIIFSIKPSALEIK